MMNEGAEQNDFARPRPSPNSYNTNSARASNYSETPHHVPFFLYRNSKAYPNSDSAAAASEIDAVWRSQIPNSVSDQRSTHSSTRQLPYNTESHTQNPTPITSSSVIKPVTMNPESHKVKKSRSCCCCCRSRTGALCCALTTVILVIGIALAAFFLWPRVPTVKLVSITQKGTNNPIQSTGFGDLYQATSNGYSANVQINLVVTNNNYIDLVINKLTLKGGLKGGSNININNFVSGNLPSSVNLRKLATSPFNIPVTLTLPNDDVTQLSSLTQVCSSKGNLNMPYTISLSLALVSWTGYTPSLSDTFSFPCPWTIPV